MSWASRFAGAALAALLLGGCGGSAPLAPATEQAGHYSGRILTEGGQRSWQGIPVERLTGWQWRLMDGVEKAQLTTAREQVWALDTFYLDPARRDTPLETAKLLLRTP